MEGKILAEESGIETYVISKDVWNRKTVVELTVKIVDESLSKSTREYDKRLLNDIIPHLSKIMENGQLFAVERVAHTDNKKALYAYRVYSKINYISSENGNKKRHRFALLERYYKISKKRWYILFLT